MSSVMLWESFLFLQKVWTQTPLFPALRPMKHVCAWCHYDATASGIPLHREEFHNTTLSFLHPPVSQPLNLPFPLPPLLENNPATHILAGTGPRSPLKYCIHILHFFFSLLLFSTQPLADWEKWGLTKPLLENQSNRSRQTLQSLMDTGETHKEGHIQNWILPPHMWHRFSVCSKAANKK